MSMRLSNTIRHTEPSAVFALPCARGLWRRVSVHRRLCFETAADGSTNRLDRFIYDNYLCVARNRWHPDGTSATNRFVWDPTEPVATRPLAFYQHNASPQLYAHDGNKNVSELVSVNNGTITAHYEYSSFGEVILSSGDLALSNPFRFSSEYSDDALGLVYYNYRHLESVTGRWLQRDGIEELDCVNLYGFCRNDSLTYNDKFGYVAGDVPINSVSGWDFSPVVWDEPSESLNFTVSYTMSKTERQCCSSITVDRYVRKLLGIGNRFGPYVLDHAAEGGMTDAFKPYVGYAEGDSPDGQTLFLYRLPWTQSFKWEARCTGGPNKGKILSIIERQFKTSGHWLWNPKREGFFL